MKQGILFYRRAYEDTSQNALWQYMHDYYVNAYAKLAKDLTRSNIIDTELLFAIKLYCYGAIGMTKDWVLTDNITSAETLAQMMFNSMPESLRKIYFSR